MTPEEYRALLRRHDDPVHLEWPGGWTSEAGATYAAAERRFLAFAEDIRQALGCPCAVESGAAVQDSSFLGQISLPRQCFLDNKIAPLRVSNFGDFATVYGDDASVDPDCFQKIKSLMEQYGYIYIPPVFLWEPYTGLTGIENWGIRYFDWL